MRVFAMDIRIRALFFLRVKTPSKRRFQAVVTGVALALALGGGGCQKQPDGSSQESVQLLKEIRAAVSNTYRSGEAFLVLKSDVVVPLADMQVVCLPAAFKLRFDAWRAGVEGERAGELKAAIAKDPQLQAKLRQVDEAIARAVAAKDLVSKDAQQVLAQAVNGLLATLEEKERSAARNAAALADYRRIADPLAAAISETEGALSGWKTQEAEALQTVLTTTNGIILQDAIRVPKLKASSLEEFFRERDSLELGGRRSNTDNFVLSRRPKSAGNLVEVIVASNLPASLEGTRCEPVLQAAYAGWKELRERRTGLEQELKRRQAALAAALIPWSNRFDIPRGRVAAFVEAGQQEAAALEEHRRRLAALQGGGEEAQALLQKEREARTTAADEELAKLRAERESVVATATGSALRALEGKQAAAFGKMLLDSASFVTQTGSRGDFSVPADAAYVFAQRHRSNGEHIVWLLAVDRKSPSIRLCNSNAASSASSPNEGWMLEARLN